MQNKSEIMNSTNTMNFRRDKFNRCYKITKINDEYNRYNEQLSKCDNY